MMNIKQSFKSGFGFGFLRLFFKKYSPDVKRLVSLNSLKGRNRIRNEIMKIYFVTHATTIDNEAKILTAAILGV